MTDERKCRECIWTGFKEPEGFDPSCLSCNKVMRHLMRGEWGSQCERHGTMADPALLTPAQLAVVKVGMVNPDKPVPPKPRTYGDLKRLMDSLEDAPTVDLLEARMLCAAVLEKLDAEVKSRGAAS